MEIFTEPSHKVHSRAYVIIVQAFILVSKPNSVVYRINFNRPYMNIGTQVIIPFSKKFRSAEIGGQRNKSIIDPHDIATVIFLNSVYTVYQ